MLFSNEKKKFITCLSGQFPGHVVDYFHLDLNERKGGIRFLAGWTQEEGGHLDAYCVQQGGGGVCN